MAREAHRSKAAWADAASYTMADITMLRKELVIGYVVAGFLTVLVPTHVWNDVFLNGHGFWTSLENVVVGPFIAFISFVCSIGNVPMAAALWHGGISFGGVISFIFADLITLPLVLIYRKYYGTRLTLRLFVWFCAVMAAAGLIVEGLFAALGADPRRAGPTDRRHDALRVELHDLPQHRRSSRVFGVLYWLYRNRERLGGGAGYAHDPVCGMQVRTASAPAHSRFRHHAYSFCSDRCRERFEADPARFVEASIRRSAPLRWLPVRWLRRRLIFIVTSSRWCCRSSGRRSSCRRAASCRRRRGRAPSPASRAAGAAGAGVLGADRASASDGARSSSGQVHRRRARRRRSSTPGSVGCRRSPTVMMPIASRLSSSRYSTASRRKM